MTPPPRLNTLLRAGSTRVQVAERLGLTRAAVDYWCAKLGVGRHECGSGTIGDYFLHQIKECDDLCEEWCQWLRVLLARGHFGPRKRKPPSRKRLPEYERVMALVRDGMSPRTAARQCNVREKTVESWARKARMAGTL